MPQHIYTFATVQRQILSVVSGTIITRVCYTKGPDLIRSKSCASDSYSRSAALALTNGQPTTLDKGLFWPLDSGI
jgi:hypothetical protein